MDVYDLQSEDRNAISYQNHPWQEGSHLILQQTMVYMSIFKTLVRRVYGHHISNNLRFLTLM